MQSIKIYLRSLSNLHRRSKQYILIASDVFILNISFCLSLSLGLSEFFPIQEILQYWIVLFLIPVSTIPIFVRFGLYRAVLNYMGIKTILAAVKSITLSILIVAFIASFSDKIILPNSILAIYWFVSILIVLGTRRLAYWLIYKFPEENKNMVTVAIYGAGRAGGMLAEGIEKSNRYSLEAIFDDDKTKIGTTIKSTIVYDASTIDEIILKKNIKTILLAIPSLGKSHRKKLLNT